MSTRPKLLAATLSIVVATSACAGIADDSTQGSTLPPLDVVGSIPPESVDTTSTSPDAAESSTTAVATTVAPTTSSSSLPPSATSSTTTAPSSTTSTTEPDQAAGNDGSGVEAVIGGRSLGFGTACLDGRNVTLDGVTWAFAGNSFRLAGSGDARSEAELVGDGWTMPMLVGSVSNGVYRYVGMPVDGSVSSAEVVVDFNELSNC